MKWVLHCIIAVSRAHWAIKSHNLSLQVDFIFQSFLVLTVVFIIVDFFSMKKQRNNEKNKPSRFNYLRDGISDVIAFKQQAMKEEVMNYSSSTALLEMEEELKFLTSSSKSLISRFLRMKEEYEDNQEVYDGLLLKYRLGYCQVVTSFKQKLSDRKHINDPKSKKWYINDSQR